MTQAIDLLEGRPLVLRTLIIAVASLLIGAGTFIVELKGSRGTKRRLSVRAFPSAPLLTEESQGVGSIRVEHNGSLVSDPQVVTFLLDNYGNAAIDSSCFDRGRPIRLELGVPVLEVMKISDTSFEYSSDATGINFGPDLLKPRQGLTAQLLVDGSPDLSDRSVLEDFLTGVDVEYVAPGKSPKFQPRAKMRTIQYLPWVIGIGFLIVSLAPGLIRPDAQIQIDPADTRPGQIVKVTGSSFRPNELVRVAVLCGGGDPLLGFGSKNYALAEVAADRNGEFRVSATIPTFLDLAGCGLYALQEPAEWWQWGASAKRSF